MGFDCSGGAGVGAAEVVVAGLGACGYGNVYGRPPRVRECCEPVVVRSAGWEREARFDDGVVRGVERVRVYVCMDCEVDACSTACAVARDLPRVDWLGASVGLGASRAAGGIRILGCSCGAPEALGRDSSGRWVYCVLAECTVLVAGDDGCGETVDL